MSEIIQEKALRELISGLIAQGVIVGGPVAVSEHRIMYQKVDSADDIRFDASVMPSNSIKEFFFPKHETICSYHYEGQQLVVIDAEPFSAQRLPDKSLGVYDAVAQACAQLGSNVDSLILARAERPSTTSRLR